ncbi:hypothetical protein K437DRAFT_22753 [Tilletiaria anomala UBC 951]|uniref:Ras-GAP domain-containing protein n=1 Tax=Tilletiaria anomala (strain ATCC 24038 / CBS 436.72 / UBC 951) TaxID=1037660 RepID=A0A066VDY6_TILAU|nr:uncharacterized protein K437DRAFT_22753 [Tilletiaria anomala UBC 951]KDN38513.1 hypothetical protein K437DRAFT_22753 [Tilletiaria anomala UBC 951]
MTIPLGGAGPPYEPDNDVHSSHHDHASLSSSSHFGNAGHGRVGIAQRESSSSLPHSAHGMMGGPSAFAHSSSSSTAALHAGIPADHSGSFIPGVSSAVPLELPGRVSSSGSTIGTENMMGSAGQMLIGSILSRFVERLPSTCGWRLTTLENDEMIRTSIANLVSLSERQISIILKDILSHLEGLQRAAQHVSEESISGMDLLASQLFLLKVLVACLFQHWKSVGQTKPADSQCRDTSSQGPWIDPPPLDDALAKHALSTMTIYLKLTIAREEAGLFSSFPAAEVPERGSDHLKSPQNGTVGGKNADRALGLPRDALKFGSSRTGKEKEKEKDRDKGKDGDRDDAEGRDADNGDKASDAWSPSNLLLVEGSPLFSIFPTFPPTLSPFGSAGMRFHSKGNFPPEFNRDWHLADLHGKTTQEAVELGEVDDLPSLMTSIYRHASMVIFYLSSSNWAVVFARIRNRLAYLSTTIEESPNTAELRLLECSNLHRQRLGSVVSELCTTFLHLKRSAQQTIAVALRRGIWNWIYYHPEEFAQMYATGRRLEGASDVLFDQVYNLAESTRKKLWFWPMLNSLLMLCPDIVGRAAIGEGRKSGSVAKKVQFLEGLRKSLRTSKLSDVAAVCCVDLVRAAAFTQRAESGLRLVVPDIERELREKVFEPMRTAAGTPRAEEVILATDLMHSFYCLDPHKTMKELIPPFAAENGSISAKVVLAKACIRVASGFGRLPWHPQLRLLYPQLAKTFRFIFKDTAFKLSRQSGVAVGKQESKRPLSRGGSRTASNPSDQIFARTELANNILNLWCADQDMWKFGLGISETPQRNPDKKAVYTESFLIECLNTDTYLALFWSTAFCMHAPGMEVTAFRALAFCLYPSSRTMQSMTRGDIVDEHARLARGTVSPTTLTGLFERLIWGDSPASFKFHVGILRPLLLGRARYYAALKPQDRRESPWSSLERERAAEDVTAEIAVLLTICNSEPDICHGAMQLGRSFAQGHDAFADVYSSQNPSKEWRDFYYKLAEDSSLFVGRIAQQKKVRSLLRTINSPSPASLAAWKEAYRRWAALTQVVARPLAADTSDTAQEKAAYWYNLSGFLSALGGACAIEDANLLPSTLQDTLLNPKLVNTNPPVPMIESFMQEMVDLLVSDSIWVREKVKETLGTDLSPRLNGILLRQIHAVLSDFFDKSTGLPRPAEMFTVFVEQSISVVQMVLNRMSAQADATTNVDIGSLMVLYVEYVNSLGRKDQALRIKVAMCQLCETLMSKKAAFLFSNELRVRNRLFQALVTWTSDSADDAGGSERSERLQRDLDVICLKTIASLLDRLPLILADDALFLDDKVEWAKSRQFSMYFNYFLKVLNRTRDLEAKSMKSEKGRDSQSDSAVIKDSAILALSNLLASNIDSGLQHSLPLAYKEDPRIRTAFMQIMTNVISQGAQFEDLERLAGTQQQNKMVELICEGDMQLALSICQISRGFDADSLDYVLLNIFDSRGEVMRFLGLALEEEVERTPSEEMVFRSNSFRTHLLSVYAKMHGYEYLRSVLEPLVVDMISRSRGVSFEIDPQRIEPGESVVVNQARLEELAQSFIDAICTSAHRVPAVLQELCRRIRVLMDAKFPNSRYQGVGGFMFLRFISPAVVAPQLIDLDLGSSTKEARRGLLLVSKILQTLASNNLFPTHKEPFMTSLNDFLKRNVWRVTNFLDQVSDATSELDRASAGQHSIFALGYTLNESDQRSLHRFLYDNVDKIGKDLLSRSASSRAKGDLAASDESKRIYENLCIALAEMGDYSVLAPVVLAQQNVGVDNRQSYEDFMRRNVNRHLDPQAFAKVFRIGPPSKAGRPVVYYTISSIRAASFDFEALIAHVLQMLQPLFNREFDLLLDMTGMSSEHWIPPQWLLYWTSLLPSEVRRGLRNLIAFNPNSSTKESLRPYFLHEIEKLGPLDNALAAPANLDVHFCTSLAELEAFIARKDIDLNASTMSIAMAPVEHTFPNATLISHYRALLPVSFRLGSDHLQIMSLKLQEMFMGRSSYTNEVIHFADIDDVRPVTNRSEETAFILTCKGGRSAFLFLSKDRTEIVQSLRQAKARVGRTAATKTERTLMPSDVPGTLLNMALLNMTSTDYMLRASAYNLLCALSTSFNFGTSSAKRRLLSVQGLALPANMTTFVADLSKDFAVAAPGVSLEFLISFFEGFEASAPSQRPACLLYMVPWLSNLSSFMHSAREQQSEYLKRIKEVLGHLIKITVQHPELYATMQRNVWTHFSKLDGLLPIVLEVFTEAAVDSGLQTRAFEAVLDTMVSFTSFNLRGKLLSRLRKAIARTAKAPSATPLTDNAAWVEIATLVRMNMVLSFTNRMEVMLYLPELLHVLLLLAGTGSDAMRRAIHGSGINLIHSLCTEDPREAKSEVDAALPPGTTKLRALLATFAGDEALKLFGLRSGELAPFAGSMDIFTESPTNEQIEVLALRVYQIAELAAPTVDTANSWRARLTSLITSTAFQYNPFIQSRAFILLGCLAQGEIDDDLLYQILVSLRGSISEWGNNGNDGPMISILACLSKVVKILPRRSRYLPQMFWLGICMVQFGHIPTFRAGVELLHSALQTIWDRNLPQESGRDLPTFLLEARTEFRESSCRLDDETGVDFELDFGFAMAALLVKGLRSERTQAETIAVLRSLLRFTSYDIDGRPHARDGKLSSYHLGYFVALLPTAVSSEDCSSLLEMTGIDADVSKHVIDDREKGSWSLFSLFGAADKKEALLISTLVAALLEYATSDDEKLLLYTLLADAALARPAIVSILYDWLSPGMQDVFVKSQNPQVIKAVHSIASIAVCEPVFAAQAAETARRGGPSAYLEESGFASLLDCGCFHGRIDDGQRIMLARLSTALLTGLIDAGAQ